jgi:hypothetical protein
MQAPETAGASIAPPAPPWAAIPASDADEAAAAKPKKPSDADAASPDIDAAARVDDIDAPLPAGKRLAWLAAGLLAGFPGALIGWLCNRDAPRRKRQALICSIIGAVAGLGLALVLSGCAVALAQAAQTPQAAQAQSPYIRADVSADHDFRAAA